jgi:hypothetical protein
MALIALLGLSSVASAASSPRQSFTERYNVLSERNIFLKDRSQATTRPASTSQPTRNDPEHTMALTGVVFEDNGFRAYVENSAGTVSRLSIGDTVARGKITDIQIDGVAYASSGQTTSITIGDDFTGHPATFLGESSSASSSSTNTASTAPSGVEGLNPNDPSLTMEQKLKLRRMQELKGR